MNEKKGINFYTHWIYLMVTIIAASTLGTAINIKYRVIPLLKEISQLIQSVGGQLNVGP